MGIRPLVSVKAQFEGVEASLTAIECRRPRDTCHGPALRLHSWKVRIVTECLEVDRLQR